MITWNSRYRLNNSFYLFWGASYLFYGFIILFHLLFYENIGIFNSSKNLSDFVWVVGGYYLSLCLWVATYFIAQPLNIRKCLWILFFITVLLIGVAFSGFIPDLQMKHHQVPLFKTTNVLLVCMICFACLKRIASQKHLFSLQVFSNIQLGLLFFIVTQGFFLIETHNNRFIFLCFYFFQICSFSFFYRVFIEMGIFRPMHLIVNELIQKQKSTQENKENDRLLFENMNEGVAYHKIVTNNEGKPVDYMFLNINQSYERHTGLKRQDLIGKYFSKALPHVYQDAVDWVQIFGEVALERKSLQFDQYSDNLDRWFHISAFCPEKGCFVTIVKDITQKKKNEIQLTAKQEKLEQHMKTSSQEIFEKELSLFRIKEELKEFTCITSHDLCEPLRGVYNLSNMLKESLIENCQKKEINSSLDQLSCLSQQTHDQVKLILTALQKTQMEQYKNR